MVVCEAAAGRPFPAILAVSAVGGILFVSLVSTIAFYYFYCKPTYEKWRHKSSAEYPDPLKVRVEIVQMLKGSAVSSVNAALAVYLASRQLSLGHCATPSTASGWALELLYQTIYFFFLEFYSFLYHYCGHTTRPLWIFHRFHHQFFNPSPYAVIADEFVDQLARSFPMVLGSIFLPLNVDLMLFQMSVLHYTYGTYLHSGHELPYPDAHHSIINTSFQHYCHHRLSIKQRPYHCGFYLKISDRLFGSLYEKECFCAKCEREKGNRSFERWEKVRIPDYSVMLTWSFWVDCLKEEFRKMKSGDFWKFT